MMNQPEVAHFFPETLLHSTVFYLAVTDEWGKCIYTNPLLTQKFASGIASDSLLRLFPEADKTRYQEAIKNALMFKGQPVSVTVKLDGKPAQWARWELTAREQADAVYITHIGHKELTGYETENRELGDNVFLFGLDNDKVRSLVNHIPGAIYRCRGDENVTLEFFSEGIERLTGYPLSYFLNDRLNGFSNLIYEPDREMFRQNDRRMIMEKGKFQIEYRIVTKQGEVKWVLESGKVNDAGDGTVFIDGYIFDITSRKQTEEALAISEGEVRKLALVAHNSTNSVMITDASENIIWINEGYTRISGFTLEEIRSKKIGYSLQTNGAETEASKKIRSYLSHRMPFKDEFISYTKTGEPIWLEVDCQPLQDETGRHLGFMAVENDITERKKAQKEQEELVQRLSLATDSAEIGIFEIDLGTNQVIWDDRMYELYECEKEPGLNLYRIFFKAMHPDDSEMMARIIGELLSQKKEIDGAVYRIIVPGGKIKYIESHAIIKKSDSGRIISLIGTNRDITEAIEVQEKLKSQNKVLRDIAFIQSHEVRRPLANILGMIEILESSGNLKGLEIFDHLVESAKELDKQIRIIVNKANDMDDTVFR